jgi:hypothetical protein
LLKSKRGTDDAQLMSSRFQNSKDMLIGPCPSGPTHRRSAARNYGGVLAISSEFLAAVDN